MKIPTSIRQLYESQREPNGRLQKNVDELLAPIAARRKWHYESRLKSELSVALKLESGRIKDPYAIEDFFACTIVVRNLSEIEEAEALIGERFAVRERRPRSAQETHKASSAFPFDDVRLYARWKDDQALPPTELEDVTFEIQIKTFLQHAWGIATHDLVYKTDDVSWSRQRIAFQIKAMLEHAEISIQEADRLAESASLDKGNKHTMELRAIIALLREVWEPEFLPDDLRRLAENTRTVLSLAGVRIDRFKNLIETERRRQKGALPVNISPYGIIVQSVAWHEAEKIREGLSDNKRRDRIFVTDEMDLPDWMRSGDFVNIIRL